MSLLLKIVIGIAAVGLGVYLGMPGKEGRTSRPGQRRWTMRSRGPDHSGVHDKQRIQELEAMLGRSHRGSSSTKRHFTPLDLLRTSKRGSVRRRAGTRRYFKTTAPRRDGRGRP